MIARKQIHINIPPKYREFYDSKNKIKKNKKQETHKKTAPMGRSVWASKIVF